MSAPRFATVTARHDEGNQEANRVTLYRRAVPASLRPVAAALVLFALADLATYRFAGDFAVDRAYCYVSLIGGIGVWLTDLICRTRRELHAELEQHRARQDLCAALDVLARRG